MTTASFSISKKINAPAENVYGYIANLPRHSEWNYRATEVEKLTDGPVAVGSKFRILERLPRDLPAKEKFMLTYFLPIMKKIYGFGDHNYATITALEPGSLLSWKTNLPGRKGDMMRMNWEIVISDEGERACVVTQRCQIVPPETSPFVRMVNDDMLDMSRKEATANLGELKRILES